jgi:HlyD family secretion protein
LVLADLSGWSVEIEELREDEVTCLVIGEPVIIRLDALPGLELNGRVESIGWVYQEKEGEVLYSAKISLPGNPAGLRWGMTARVTLQAGTGDDV